jgi:hypothetical protein
VFNVNIAGALDRLPLLPRAGSLAVFNACLARQPLEVEGDRPGRMKNSRGRHGDALVSPFAVGA